jgi:hypothetical protein
VLSRSEKRATSLADRELDHLSAVISALRQTRLATTRLSCSYWHARVAAVATEYILIASQRRRIDCLRRDLHSIEATLEDAGQRSKRVAA